MRWLVLALLVGCASVPKVLEVVPEKDPVCGWTNANPWTHCCVARSGPVLVVKCAEFQRVDNTPPPFEAPKES